MTVDPELIAAGNRAVAAGEADSLSGWVNTALADRALRDARVRALKDAVAAYEAEFGEITAEEMAAIRRADRANAIVVRGGSTGPARHRRARKSST